MLKLGVNIDHVATIREARKTVEPDPIWAAVICELAGCHSIVTHLRQDRRHIKDRDVFILKESIRGKLNLEMSISKEIVDIACKVQPDQSTLVPEKRQELTTEGGLDVAASESKIGKVIEKLKKNNILVSLFIDPDEKQIRASGKLGADSIELHTGRYANACGQAAEDEQISKIRDSVRCALDLGLTVNAGHGLTYRNVRRIAEITGIEELNIGHTIISRAVMSGLGTAVKEMLGLLG